MSKQSESKILMGYSPHPRNCANCTHYSSILVPNSGYSAFLKEKEKKCSIGGFAVKKTATCDQWYIKEPE
jgi:hypothetical protein